MQFAKKPCGDPKLAEKPPGPKTEKSDNRKLHLSGRRPACPVIGSRRLCHQRTVRVPRFPFIHLKTDAN